MRIGERTTQEFLTKLNSAAPTPGGGAVAGLCGAMSAALAGMVAHLTVGKPKFAQAEFEMQKLLKEAQASQNEMLRLAEEDQKAFSSIVEAYKLPKATEEEEAERHAAIEDAAKAAALVPLAIAQLAEKVMRLAQTAVQRGNPGLVTDGVAACILARAVIRISSYNVRINLNSIRDDRDFNEDVQTKLNRCEHHAAILEATVVRSADRIVLKN